MKVMLEIKVEPWTRLCYPEKKLGLQGWILLNTGMDPGNGSSHIFLVVGPL